MHRVMGSTFGSATRCAVHSPYEPSQKQSLSCISPRAAAYAFEAALPMPARSGGLQCSELCDSAGSMTGIRARSPVASLHKIPPASPIGTPPAKGRKLSSSVTAAAASKASFRPSLIPARFGARKRLRVLPLPVLHATATDAEAEDTQVSFTSTAGRDVTVRKIRTLDELRQVATLRAEAYYAENQSRFVGSLKKKFVEQEVESLQQRTTIMSRQGKPYSECLVAVDSSTGAVLACIDLRLPAALNGTHPHGVPPDDPHGCYLLNVVVREDVRGQGLGRGVMRAAMARAVELWGAQQLYTHVEADNEVAYRLYCGCGFAPHSLDARYEAASKLGQTVLLQAPASAATA